MLQKHGTERRIAHAIIDFGFVFLLLCKIARVYIYIFFFCCIILILDNIDLWYVNG